MCAISAFMQRSSRRALVLRVVPGTVAVALVGAVLAASVRPVAAEENLSFLGGQSFEDPQLLGAGIFDEYGASVALSADGQTLVVGAPESPNMGVDVNEGEVTVYNWDANTSSWVQQGPLLRGQQSGDRFGQAVAISADGSTIAVGTTGFDGIVGIDRGAVRVFDLDDMGDTNISNDTWVQRGGSLGIADGADRDRFGSRVALSADGNTLVGGVGFAGMEGAGQVSVFEWNGSEWSTLGDPFVGSTPGENLGISIAVAEDAAGRLTVAMGSSGELLGTGRVEVYDWDQASSDWSQRGAPLDGGDVLDNSNQVALSADGNILVVGSKGVDTAGQDAGQVSVYEWNGSNWVVRGSPINGEKAYGGFGVSVALSGDGNRLVVSANSVEAPNVMSPASNGEVQLFIWNGTDWEKLGPLLRGGVADRLGLDRQSLLDDDFDLGVDALAISADLSIVAAGASQTRANDTIGANGYVVVYEPLFIDQDLSSPPDSPLNGSGTLSFSGSCGPTGSTIVVDATDGAVSATPAVTTCSGTGEYSVSLDLPPAAQQLMALTSTITSSTTGKIASAVANLCEGLKATILWSPEASATNGDDVIWGTPGDDMIDALAGNDTVCSLGGDDEIDGGDGADKISGGPGRDIILGRDGDDLLMGGNGADTLWGGDGADTLKGGANNDTLVGNSGDDVLLGGNDDDMLSGDGGDDSLDGQSGLDDCYGGTTDETLGDSAVRCETTVDIELL